MKKYLKEIIIVLLQIFIFYLFPLFCGPTDAMGMVILMLLVTIILSTILTTISNNKIKYCYPIFVSLLFIPSVAIYYNSSALIHSVWYLVSSFIGMIIGFILNKIIFRITRNQL